MLATLHTYVHSVAVAVMLFVPIFTIVSLGETISYRSQYPKYFGANALTLIIAMALGVTAPYSALAPALADILRLMCIVFTLGALGIWSAYTFLFYWKIDLPQKDPYQVE